MVALGKPTTRASPCQPDGMSRRNVLPTGHFTHAAPKEMSRTVRIRSAVLAFVSAGFKRVCRPTPRRAAASSTAFFFASKSPPGTSPLPSPSGAGGMVGPAGWGVGWGCVMVPMVSGPAFSDSAIQVPVTVTGITPVTLIPGLEHSQFLRSRRSPHGRRG